MKTYMFRRILLGSRVGNLVDPGGGLRDFQTWLLLHARHEASTDAEESPSKKQRSEEECKICFANPIDSVFTPCGHVLACFACANTVEKCPICNAASQALKTYRA